MELGVVFAAEVSKNLQTSTDKLLAKLKKIELQLKNGISSSFSKFNTSATEATKGVSRALISVGTDFSRTSGLTQQLSNNILTLGTSADTTSKKLRSVTNVSGGLTTKLKQMGDAGKHAGSMSAGLEGFIEFTGRFFAVWRIYWAVLGVLKDVTGVAKEFASQMGQVQGVTAASAREMVGLKEAAGEIGTTMLMSLGEAAKGMRILSQAGLSAKEVQESVNGVAKLAQATGASFDETARLSTTVMKVWNIQASEMTRISDVMANAVLDSKLELSDLNTIFNYLAPSAKMAGYSLEQTAAAVSVMANAGMKASTIGTGLSTMLSEIIKESDGFRESLNKVGLKFSDLKDASGQLKPIPVIIDTLSKAGLKLDTIFSGLQLRSARMLTTMVDQGGGAFERMERRMNIAGTTARMFAASMNPPLVKLHLFYNQIITQGALAFEKFSVNLLYGIDLIKAFGDSIGFLSVILVAKLIPPLIALGTNIIQNVLYQITLFTMACRTASAATVIMGIGIGTIAGWAAAAVAAIAGLIYAWKRWGQTADDTGAKLAEQQGIAIRAANEIEDLAIAYKAGVTSEKELVKKTIEINKLLRDLNIKERLSVEDIKTDGFKPLLDALDLVVLKTSLISPKMKEAVSTISENLKKIEELKKTKEKLEKEQLTVGATGGGNLEPQISRITSEIEKLEEGLGKAKAEIQDFASIASLSGWDADNFAQKLEKINLNLDPTSLNVYAQGFKDLAASMKEATAASKEVSYPPPATDYENKLYRQEMTVIRLKEGYDKLNNAKNKNIPALIQQQKLLNAAEQEVLKTKNSKKFDDAKLNDRGKILLESSKDLIELEISGKSKVLGLEKEQGDYEDRISKLKKENAILTSQEKLDSESILGARIALEEKLRDLRKGNEAKGIVGIEDLKRQRDSLIGKTDEKSLEKYNELQTALNAALREENKEQKNLSAHNIQFNEASMQRKLDFNIKNLELAKMEAGITISSHDQIIAKKKELIVAEQEWNNARITAIQREQQGADVATQVYRDRENEIQRLKIKNAELTGSIGKLKTEWELAGQQIGSSIGNNVGSVFNDLIEGSKSVSEAIGDMAKSIIADILKIITKLLVMKAIQSTIGQTSFGRFLGLDSMKFGGAFSGGRAFQKFKAFASGGKVKDNLIGRFNSQEGIISGPGMKMLGKKFDAINRGDNLLPGKPKSGGGGKEGVQPQLPMGNTNVFNISAVDTNSFMKLLSSTSSQNAIAGAVQHKFKHNNPVRSTIRKGR